MLFCCAQTDICSVVEVCSGLLIRPTFLQHLLDVGAVLLRCTVQHCVCVVVLIAVLQLSIVESDTYGCSREQLFHVCSSQLHD